MQKAYKAFTYQLCSPFRGGPPVWDGGLPFALPEVDVDASEEECSFGWHAMRSPEGVLLLTGLWPDGWPARVFEVETVAEVVERKQKLRASTWTITRELSEVEIGNALRETAIGNVTVGSVEQQLGWREALRRPEWCPGRVEELLSELCRKRQGMMRFPDVRLLEEYAGLAGLPCEGQQTWLADGAWRCAVVKAGQMRLFDINPWLRETAIWMPLGGRESAVPWRTAGAFDAARALTVTLAQPGGGWFMDPKVTDVARRLWELYYSGLLVASVVDAQGTVGWVMCPEEAE